MAQDRGPAPGSQEDEKAGGDGGADDQGRAASVSPSVLERVEATATCRAPHWPNGVPAGAAGAGREWIVDETGLIIGFMTRSVK